MEYEIGDIIGACGEFCLECPIYIATKIGSQRYKQNLADSWQQNYAIHIDPHELYCLGCLCDDAHVFKNARKCKIRAEAQKKAIFQPETVLAHRCPFSARAIDFCSDTAVHLKS